MAKVKKAKVDHQSNPAFALFRPSEKKLNPSLAALFTTSAGPVKQPPRSAHIPAKKIDETEVSSNEAEQDDEILSEVSEELVDLDEDPEDDEVDGVDAVSSLHEKVENGPDAFATKSSSGKRKRKREDNDDLEGKHLRKIAREEAREFEKLQAQRAATRAQQAKQGIVPVKPIANDDQDDEDIATTSEQEQSGAEASDAEGRDADSLDPPPMHETLAPSRDEAELEKAQRTIFLANVATAAITDKAAKKTLMNHLASFFPHLPEDSGAHRIESLRFRSTAYSSHIPRKAAFARKDVMEETSKSTNAYAVYSTKLAAREAAKRLNGSVVLGRHMRVDEVAHPMKQDHRRCVFVGNLGFVDDDSRVRESEAAEGRSKRKPQTGDVEEGLWVQFSKAGKVESVRVPRDPKTRIGKGFAYVQFADQNGVEAALLFNEKKYPPMLPRKLRVSRAKKFTAKKEAAKEKPRLAGPGSKKSRGVTDETKSLQGRVSRMLGKAGAASLRKSGGLGHSGAAASFKSPENVIFEGARASTASGKPLKMGGSGRKKDGKRGARSTSRSQAWKKKTNGGAAGNSNLNLLYHHQTASCDDIHNATMQSIARTAVRSLPRARLSQTSRRWASDSHGHGHDAHHGPVSEGFGKSFYLILAAIPTIAVVYAASRPSPTGQPHALTKYLDQFSSWRKTWEERNALHTKMVEQAGHDRNLFLNTPQPSYVDHRFPEVLGNTGSPYNVKAGHKADMSEVRQHLEGKLRREEEQKIKQLGW